MTIQIKHAFTSAKGDGGDATLVRPSNWNAAHSTSMATGQLLGRLTAGVGVFEEIPVSAYMASLFNAADAATLAGMLGLFETGDVKYTFKTAASSGWVLIQGGSGTPGNTIGNASSGAVSRANADCLALFVLIYGACSDAIAPVSGGRTGNATNDFNANKTIRVPNLVGRSPIGAGGATNDGTTTRTLGTLYGTETHTLTAGQLPASIPYTDPGHAHNVSFNMGISSSFASIPFGGNSNNTVFNFSTASATTGITINPSGGSSHPILHPVVALNAMVKL